MPKTKTTLQNVLETQARIDKEVDTLYQLVAQARSEGCSWQQIADRLDVARQTAIARFSAHCS